MKECPIAKIAVIFLFIVLPLSLLAFIEFRNQPVRERHTAWIAECDELKGSCEYYICRADRSPFVNQANSFSQLAIACSLESKKEQ